MKIKRHTGLIAGFILVAFFLTLQMFHHRIEHFFNPLAAIEMGTNPDVVVKDLGSPQRTYMRGDTTVYVYPKGEVYFQNSKVVASSWKLR